MSTCIVIEKRKKQIGVVMLVQVDHDFSKIATWKVYTIESDYDYYATFHVTCWKNRR